MIKTVQIRNVDIGEKNTKMCVPLTAHDIEGIVKEAALAVEAGSDLIEWRADCYEPSGGNETLQGTLKEGLLSIRKEIGDLPLLFTLRSFEEGGSRRMSEEEYFSLNQEAISSGIPDLIDLEYTKNREQMELAISEAHNAGMKVILSQHDFLKTPSEKELMERYLGMQSLGADITKQAVMPIDSRDVFRLLSVAKRMKNECADRPFIAISMGEEGMVSRVFAEHIGSAITYAAGENASAPGQIKAAELKKLLTRLRDKGLPPQIFLIGFMGSGKTTVGKHLGLLLQHEFIDMDALIEQREQMTILRIFEMQSEEYFRELEHKTLMELSQREAVVVACGGGVVGNDYTSEKNETSLAQGKTVVFIKDTEESMFGRIAHDKTRPLAASEMRSLEEQFGHLSELYHKRLPYYEQTATITVDAAGKNPYQIAVEVLSQL